jgi:hypothetical protein
MILLGCALLAGCAGTHPKGVSRVDEFDGVKVDQMSGNNVSRSPMQKVILCLNARRESRPVTAVTNITVSALTNAHVIALTNEIITIATNYLFTAMTNVAPALGGPAAPVTEEAAAAAAATVTVADTAATVAQTNTGPAFTTNSTVSLARNHSATTGPAQKGLNSQAVQTFNNQITTQSNNLTVSVMTNIVVTAETNATVSFATNLVISSVTNVGISSVNEMAHDYFLYTELVPPADFVLQSGESLVLLVDGTRHALTSSQSGTAFVGRKGFTSTLYKVSPEVLVAIANAQEVRIRLKGATSVIERTMNESSRRNFKTFLVPYFSPETQELEKPAEPSAATTASASAPGSVTTTATAIAPATETVTRLP